MATARDAVLDTVTLKVFLDLLRGQGSVLVLLPAEVCKAVKEIGVLALLKKLDVEAVRVYVAFQRAREVLWSGGGSTAWFLHSLDTTEVRISLLSSRLPIAGQSARHVMLSKSMPRLGFSSVRG